jgi:hypothetical protein
MVMAKSRENRLTFATWLMFFRDHGRFPRGPSDLESLDIVALARQIKATIPADGGMLLAERTAKRIRTEIRARFGFREATVADAEMLTAWLRDHVAAEAGGQIEPLIDRLEARCRELAIVTSKKNFNPVMVALSVIGEVPRSTKCSWKLRRSSTVAVSGGRRK